MLIFHLWFDIPVLRTAWQGVSLLKCSLADGAHIFQLAGYFREATCSLEHRCGK